MNAVARNPLRCAKAAENRLFSFDLLELHFGSRRNKHRLLFRVEESDVLVLHIRHSARRDLTEEDL
jgi:hypothetical protein